MTITTHREDDGSGRIWTLAVLHEHFIAAQADTLGDAVEQLGRMIKAHERSLGLEKVPPTPADIREMEGQLGG